MTHAASGAQPDPIAEQLRAGLRRLAKGVVVVTALHEGRRFAMAATAVNEVSMDPPSLLVCVNRTASLYEPLAGRVGFAINVLSEAHEEICTLCAGKAKGEDRFKVGRWAQFGNGVPYLEDAQASFLCRYETALDYGTHHIVVGRVEDVRIESPVGPLIYANGSFHRLGERSART
jgi:flavin reductase (DIM6/NTAB) family NADH-FMN oxidoreductase RutF